MIMQRSRLSDMILTYFCTMMITLIQYSQKQNSASQNCVRICTLCNLKLHQTCIICILKLLWCQMLKLILQDIVAKMSNQIELLKKIFNTRSIILQFVSFMVSVIHMDGENPQDSQRKCYGNCAPCHFHFHYMIPQGAKPIAHVNQALHIGTEEKCHNFIMFIPT